MEDENRGFPIALGRTTCHRFPCSLKTVPALVKLFIASEYVGMDPCRGRAHTGFAFNAIGSLYSTCTCEGRGAGQTGIVVQCLACPIHCLVQRLIEVDEGVFSPDLFLQFQKRLACRSVKILTV